MSLLMFLFLEFLMLFFMTPNVDAMQRFTTSDENCSWPSSTVGSTEDFVVLHNERKSFVIHNFYGGIRHDVKFTKISN